MNIILAGYPGSQKLVPVSKYLIEKYLPGFRVRYLNYQGPIEKWSQFVFNEVWFGADDEKIIFGLDDYLIRDYIDMKRYEEAIAMDADCIKLCPSTEEEHKEYPVTTQYGIWKRKSLAKLLFVTHSPWDFEITGSKLYKGEKTRILYEPCEYKSLLHTCIDYDNHSALSSRWDGIRLDGLKAEDLAVIKTLL